MNFCGKLNSVVLGLPEKLPVDWLRNEIGRPWAKSTERER